MTKMFFLFTALSFCLIGADAGKAETAEQESEVNEAEEGKAERHRKELKKTAALDGLSKEILKAEKGLEELDQNIAALENDLAEKEASLEKTEQAVEEAEKEKSEAGKQKEKHYGQLKERLKNLYKTSSSISSLEQLFYPDSSSLEKLSHIHKIAARDQELLESYTEEAEKLEKADERLQKQRKTLVLDKTEIEETKRQLKAEKKKKETALTVLYTSEKELEAESAAIEKDMTDLQWREEEAESQLLVIQKDDQAGETALTPAQDFTEIPGDKKWDLPPVEEIDMSEQEISYYPKKIREVPAPVPEEPLLPEAAAEVVLDEVFQGTAEEIVFYRPADGRITSPYNPSRVHPITGEVRMHSGTDFGRDGGTNIYAAEAGIVTSVGWRRGLGNTVILSHLINGKTYSTLYAHLASMHVKEEDYVERGENIAVMGTTGLSTGVHLHFEVHPGGYRGKDSAVPPENFLP